ncbi:unnamed protein product [Linum trigynum]|uniref:Uncharacterized protein n=1 Tax=Linum trigynum TaxID=586398 RepID=A0AAV2FST1_9ROSI
MGKRSKSVEADMKEEIPADSAGQGFRRNLICFSRVMVLLEVKTNAKQRRTVANCKSRTEKMELVSSRHSEIEK